MLNGAAEAVLSMILSAAEWFLGDDQHRLCFLQDVRVYPLATTPSRNWSPLVSFGYDSEARHSPVPFVASHCPSRVDLFKSLSESERELASL